MRWLDRLLWRRFLFAGGADDVPTRRCGRGFWRNSAAKIENLFQADVDGGEVRPVSKVPRNDRLPRHRIRIKCAQRSYDDARFGEVGSKYQTLRKERVAIRVATGRDVEQCASVGN